MNESASDPDLASPRSARVVRLLALLGLLLAGYLVFSVYGDPFPYPVRQIAGGALIALIVAGNVWRWHAWFKAEHARSPLIRRVIVTTMILLLVYLVFRLTYFDPMPESLGMILSFAAFPLLLALITLSIARSEDEVRRAAVFEGFAWGGLVGLGTIYVTIVTLRSSPGLADWLQSKALVASGGLNPLSYGFVLGAAFAMVVVWTCLVMGWALWWRRKR